MADWKRDLLCDPQTNGGLLVAVAPDGAAKVLELFRGAGFDRAAVIGEMRDGAPGIEIV
jgi:selenide,water dikinase